MTSPLPPRCSSRFRAERLLSSGSFGGVYLANQLDLDRQVAIKLLHHDMLGDAVQVARFRDEARITSAITHPAIVTVIDFDVENGIPWIAYEYLPGRALSAVLKSGRMSTRSALRTAASLAAGLAQAHRHGVFHRDVKPENIVEVEAGRFKLVDFGLAKWTRSSHVLTATGQVVGTPAYLAPEVFSGDEVSGQADVFSLGVVLFEMLTGRHPYEHDPVRMLKMQADGKMPAPSAFERALSPEFDPLVASALAAKPEQRPDAAALARGLEAEIKRPTARILRTGEIRKPPRPRAKLPLALGIAAAFTLLAVLTGVGLESLRERGRPAAPVAHSPAPASPPAGAAAATRLEDAAAASARAELARIRDSLQKREPEWILTLREFFTLQADLASGRLRAAKLRVLCQQELVDLARLLGRIEARLQSSERALAPDLALWLEAHCAHLLQAIRVARTNVLIAAADNRGDREAGAEAVTYMLEVFRVKKLGADLLPSAERLLDLCAALSRGVLSDPERHGSLVKVLLSRYLAVLMELRHMSFADADIRRLERRRQALVRQLAEMPSPAAKPLGQAIDDLWHLAFRTRKDALAHHEHTVRGLAALAAALPSGRRAVEEFSAALPGVAARQVAEW